MTQLTRGEVGQRTDLARLAHIACIALRRRVRGVSEAWLACIACIALRMAHVLTCMVDVGD